MKDTVRNLQKQLLSDYKCNLEKISFEYHRSDGSWQPQQRVVFSRRDAATALLYNLQTNKILLTKQFRLPTFVNGNETGNLIETCAGTLDDNETPEQCIKREIEEETGYVTNHIQRLFEAYLSPGSVTEKVYFFIAEYSSEMKTGNGGGTDETEDIALLEITLNEAYDLIATGDIQDAKTIILLQYAKLHNIMG